MDYIYKVNHIFIEIQHTEKYYLNVKFEKNLKEG